jgi:hypothetical protein
VHTIAVPRKLDYWMRSGGASLSVAAVRMVLGFQTKREVKNISFSDSDMACISLEVVSTALGLVDYH